MRACNWCFTVNFERNLTMHSVQSPSYAKIQCQSLVLHQSVLKEGMIRNNQWKMSFNLKLFKQAQEVILSGKII